MIERKNIKDNKKIAFDHQRKTNGSVSVRIDTFDHNINK